MMQDNLRAELIKQFPAEVVEVTEPSGKVYYACPTCKRAVAMSGEKCGSCSQVLSWDHVRKVENANGVKTAVLEFDVPVDFAAGDCRKCPLSYIGKSQNENVYECPLNMRTHCPLKLS